MNTTDKTAARVTIFNAPAMSEAGTKAIAKWLRKQADFLEYHNDCLSPLRYTARYIYTEGESDD